MEREREKASLLKEEVDANVASKRKKLKREHVLEAGEFSPGAPAHHPLSMGMSQSYDKAVRKGAIVHRPGYLEEPGLRYHGNEVLSKMSRHDAEQYPKN